MGFKARGAGTPRASSIPADLDHVWEKPPDYTGSLMKCRYCPAKTFPATQWLADGPCTNRAAIARLTIGQRAFLGWLYKHGAQPLDSIPRQHRRRLLRLRKLRLISLRVSPIAGPGFTGIGTFALTDIGREALKELRP